MLYEFRFRFLHVTRGFLMTICAMFPIIPQHLSVRPSYSLAHACSSAPRPAAAQEPRKKTQLSVVFAVDVPALTCTPPIPLDAIVRDKLDSIKYELELNASGQLVARGGDGSVAWVRNARISPDCHSFNTVVRRVCAGAASQSPSAVVLQTVRQVRAGHQLSVWFDEDSLAAADVPFLTPANIQGEKNYICHQCRKRFEYPNPLKIHLALECGTLRRVDLWKRLVGTAVSKEESSTGGNLALEQVYNMKLKLNALSVMDVSISCRTTLPSPDQSRLSTASNPISFDSAKSLEEPERPSSEPTAGRFSAFKPYLSLQTSKIDHSENDSSSSLLSVPRNLIFSSPPFSAQNVPKMLSPVPATSFRGKSQIHSSLINQKAVEMETLVSNFGRSNQGHLCIYCGKVYSRKYGLKIHIRTHTGFKPLKCRFCLRAFGDPSNLNKHVRLHSEGDTPYKCEECGKIMVRRRDLERHMKSRHQEDST